MKVGKRIGDLVMMTPGLGPPVGRLRARLRARRERMVPPDIAYARWVERHDTPSRDAIRRHRRESLAFALQPTISVVMPVFNPPPAVLEAAIESVRVQSYPHWELCIADDASSDPTVISALRRHAAADPRIKLRLRSTRGNISAASNTALELATGDYVALLDHDDLLPPLALHWVAEAINRRPQAQVLYSDEDKVNEHGHRFDPYFKSDFNHVLLLAQNMVSHLGVYRRDLVAAVGGFRVGFEGAQDHDLVLRCVAAVTRDEIVHIPRILYHWRAISGSTARGSDEKPAAVGAARRAVEEHVRQRDAGATVEPAPESPAHLRIRHSLPAPAPLVSVVICTRDHEHLLRTAVESIRERSTYARHEIVIIDNGSRDPGALRYLASLAGQPGLAVVRDDSPFNYSRLNNVGVRHTRGDVLCLLNDDVEVLTPGWLEELVSFAIQPDVGAVGARLWYPDGTLQHGGVIIGVGGVAGHAHLRLPKGRPGYFSRGVLQQEISAVTGACLAVRRAVYDEVGGLDERIAVAFNDVDLCLRIRAAGYRNIWTPFAELIHHESASRGYEDTPEKLARFQREVRFMQERWGATLAGDPCYNPNLSLREADFRLASPRDGSTWRRAS